MAEGFFKKKVKATNLAQIGFEEKTLVTAGTLAHHMQPLEL
jgi:hypothetical protein